MSGLSHAAARAGNGAMSDKHMGSSVDEFLRKEGMLDEARAQAIEEVVAWQLAEAGERGHANQPATSGGNCGTPGDNSTGVASTLLRER